MGFDHGAGGATGTAGAGGATGTAGAGGATGTAPRLRLSIVGTGYLGATHAVCMAELGSSPGGASGAVIEADADRGYRPRAWRLTALLAPSPAHPLRA